MIHNSSKDRRSTYLPVVLYNIHSQLGINDIKFTKSLNKQPVKVTAASVRERRGQRPPLPPNDDDLFLIIIRPSSNWGERQEIAFGTSAN